MKIFITFPTILLMVLAKISANIIHIPADYSTIQAGIESSTDGDSILVSAGTYYENINFNGKNISVIGENRETTIIDGGQNGRVVTINNGEDETTQLLEFTIMNGYAFDLPEEGDDDGTRGGGIYIQYSEPKLKNLIIKENSAHIGGGIACDEGQDNPIFENLIILNNEANAGAGIFIEHCYPLITSSSIVNNIGVYGGGVHLNSNAQNTQLFNCNISNNIGSEGGGLYINGSDGISMENILISNNQAIAGGGIYLVQCDNPLLNNFTIVNNQSEDADKGAILCNKSSPIFTNSIVYGNSSNIIEFSHWQEIPSSLTISYTNLEGGQSSIVANNNGTVNWGEGNIDEDPQFTDPEYGDFTLLPNSPCIDSGDPNSPLDPDGTIADMGANYIDQTGIILGCTNPEACNYDDYADVDDGSCLFGIDCLGECGGTTICGCTEPIACNYNDDANWNDGTCEFNSGTWFISTNGSDSNCGSEDSPYLTIQEGIESAVDGDTVLVSAGIYEFGEISFMGKTIKLISLEGPENTFLERVVVASGEGEGTEISGFTFEEIFRPAGVSNNSYLNINNCIFKNNEQENIQCNFGSYLSVNNVLIDGGRYGIKSVQGGCDINISNVTITNNSSRALSVRGSDIVSMQNSILYNNTAELHYWGEPPLILNLTYNNIAGIINSGEAGHYCEDDDEGIECNFYDNIDADPQFTDPENGDFTLLPTSPCIDGGDPNSPLDPDGTIADMGAYFFDQTGIILGCTDESACNFNVESTLDNGSCEYPPEGYNCNGDCIIDLDCAGECGGSNICACTDPLACNFNEEATSDDDSCEYNTGTWFVSTNGSDSNCGSEDSPYLTIQEGIESAVDGDTVLVSAGIYEFGEISFMGKTIKLVSLEGPENTYLERVVVASGEGDGTEISGFTFEEIFRPAGVNNNSYLNINNCIFKNNEQENIQCDFGSYLSLNNVLIDGGRFGIQSSQGSCEINISNVTITNNSSRALSVRDSVIVNMQNSILFNNAGELHYWTTPPVILNLSYNNIAGIINSDEGNPYCPDMEEGTECNFYNNIDEDPQFTNPENGDFTLLPTSPCIDAGNPNASLDLDGTIADMGAYFFDQTFGCTDESAFNFNPNSISNDGSCQYLGDVNFDTQIDISDIVLIVNFILDLEPPTEQQQMLADFNHDGEVNITDIVLIVLSILKWTPKTGQVA